MMAERKKVNLEVPEEELAEQIISAEGEGDETLAPMETRDSSVSEVDWIEQQQDVPLDDDERED